MHNDKKISNTHDYGIPYDSFRACQLNKLLTCLGRLKKINGGIVLCSQIILTQLSESLSFSFLQTNPYSYSKCTIQIFEIEYSYIH